MSGKLLCTRLDNGDKTKKVQYFVFLICCVSLSPNVGDNGNTTCVQQLCHTLWLEHSVHLSSARLPV